MGIREKTFIMYIWDITAIHAALEEAVSGLSKC